MVASRQSLQLKRSTKPVKGPSEHSFRPSRNHNQPRPCSKTHWRKQGQYPCLAHGPVGPELHRQDPWWDLGYRTGAALGVHMAEITQGRSRELDREQRKRVSWAAGDTDWCRRRDRLPASCLLLLRLWGQDWGLFLASEPNSHLHCAAIFPSQLLTTVNLDPMK